ncbi:hypothetical protein EC973_006652 [Apophysomyces ossiformis]|uniref:Uncharacterized protein n=1 Tax=Apophysomyces ossiformis TaxID=679940 RepID=A0A8H7BT48_9FUNG|nr:hypothetical protein EC973_006652 [Apophysomyces ossiformis]
MTPPMVEPHVYEQLLAEQTNKIKDIEKKLKQASQGQQSWRHKCQLLENEREKYEASVKAQYEKEKEPLETELKVLKDSHIEKIQAMSSALAQLQQKVASLQNQLKQHGITEGDVAMTYDDNLTCLAEYSDNQRDILVLDVRHKEDAEFIKDAYHKAMLDQPNPSHTVWSSVQTNIVALQREIDVFQAWRTMANIPASDLSRLARGDDRSSTHSVSSIRKALFGRKTSGKRKSNN